jgi:hypothetical protein
VWKQKHISEHLILIKMSYKSAKCQFKSDNTYILKYKLPCFSYEECLLKMEAVFSCETWCPSSRLHDITHPKTAVIIFRVLFFVIY